MTDGRGLVVPLGDERGLTVPINYLLLVGIMALLSAGLLVSTASFVDDQQERTIRTELQVVGNRVAADLSAADRLAVTVSGSGGVETEIDLPGQVAGSTYRIDITSVGGERYLVTLTSTEPDVSVSIPVRSRTPIAANGLDGDDLRVTYDPAGSGNLEVANA